VTARSDDSMAKKRKAKARKSRGANRTDEQLLADLEARLAEMKRNVSGLQQFSPEAVYEDRMRLELSAADYAKLVGVSMLTIYNWEWGKSVPQRRQLESWLKVKRLSPRKAWRELGYA
jgi:DNA-binding transcriptional regulator YiaG